MPYTHTTAETFVDTIQQGLNNSKFWTRAEIFLYLKEALTVFNSFSFGAREKVLISVPTNTNFINLLTLVDTDLNAAISFTKTISELKQEINFHLIENALSSATINKEVFDSTKFDSLIENKVNEFLLQTGLIFSTRTINLSPPPTLNVDLDLSITDIRRLVFKDTAGVRTLLKKDNEDRLKGFFWNKLNQAGKAKFYSSFASETNRITFYPSINTNGQLEVISIDSPVIASILPVPTNLSWVIKYGVLFELFSQDGDGFDPKRAEYCKSRWEQGIVLGKNYFLLLDAKANGLSIPFSSLKEFDGFSYNWFNKTITKVRELGIVSWNLIAIKGKIENPTIITLELDLLSNANVPSDESDFIQTSKDSLQALYLYVFHLCKLKLGDNAFYATEAKLREFIKSTIEENSRLNVPLNLFFPTAKRVKKQNVQESIMIEN